MRKILRRHSHVNWAIADQAMVSGVNFFTGILLARYLGLVEYGIFTLAWMSVLFVNSFQMAIILSPMMSLGPKQGEKDTPSYFGAVLIQQIFFSCLSFLVLFFGIKISGMIFPQWNVQGLALPLASAALAFQMQDFIRRYFFTRQRPLAAFVNDVISYMGQLSFLVWLFYTANVNAEQAIWVIAATSALAVIIGAFFFDCMTWDIKIFNSVTRRHWNFSRWLIASAALQWSSGHLFIVIAGGVLGATAVGAMRAALNIVGITNILFQGLENVVPIRSANHFMDRGKSGLIVYLRKMTVFCTVATVFLCGVIAVAPEFWLGLVYGDEYLQYGYLLYWYTAIYLIISLGLPLRSGLRAIEITRPIFSSYLVASVIAIVSSYPLAFMYDLNGVMAGTLLVNLSMVIVLMLGFSKQMKKIE